MCLCGFPITSYGQCGWLLAGVVSLVQGTNLYSFCGCWSFGVWLLCNVTEFNFVCVFLVLCPRLEVRLRSGKGPRFVRSRCKLMFVWFFRRTGLQYSWLCGTGVLSSFPDKLFCAVCLLLRLVVIRLGICCVCYNYWEVNLTTVLFLPTFLNVTLREAVLIWCPACISYAVYCGALVGDNELPFSLRTVPTGSCSCPALEPVSVAHRHAPVSRRPQPQGALRTSSAASASGRFTDFLGGMSAQPLPRDKHNWRQRTSSIRTHT